MQLGRGQKPALQVGDLPRPVAEYLNCHPAIVFLGHRELLKIGGKHKEIGAAEFQQLPFLIKCGRYYEDARRPRCVTVFYELPSDGKLYVAGLKAAARGCEVWIQTFHRIDDYRARAKIEIAKLIFDGS